MSIESFIEKFAAAIEVDPATVAADTVFKEHPVWDSLNTLAVIAMADTDFGVTLTGKNVESSRTLGDLWQVVASKKTQP